MTDGKSQDRPKTKNKVFSTFYLTNAEIFGCYLFSEGIFIFQRGLTTSNIFVSVAETMEEVMGFYSWDCKVCGHPMLSVYALEDKNEWMNHVVVIEEDGSILQGEYDGYGRVDDEDIESYKPECYHEHCWELAGKPTKYTKGSRSARDQGYFFPDDHHNIEPPEEIPAELCERYSIFEEWKKNKQA